MIVYLFDVVDKVVKFDFGSGVVVSVGDDVDFVDFVVCVFV